MKIANICPYFPPETNGISVALFNRVLSLSKLNHDAHAIIPKYNNEEQNRYVSQLEKNDVKVSFFSTMKINGPRLGQMPSFFKSKGEIKKNILKYDVPDIIFIDDPFIFLLGSGYLPLFHLDGVKNIGICHADIPATFKRHGMNLFSLLSKLVVPYSYNKCDKTLFANSFLEKLYPKIKNSQVIEFLGVDTTQFKYINREVISTPIDILTVGRIAPDKGIKFLYKCYKKLLETDIDFTWTFVGDGPSFEKWKSRETNSLKFKGYIKPENLFSFYKSADIFVNGCNFESYGLSIREAMATGMPVLVSDSSGSSNYIINEYDGIIFKKNSVQNFVSKIKKLVNNDSLVAKINSNLQDKINSWQDTTKKLVNNI